MDLVERIPVDHWAEIGVGVPAGADPHLLRALDQPLLELAVHRLVHDHAAGSSAALAGRAKGRPDDPLDRELQVGVVHDDDPVLAAELEVNVLQAVGSGLRHGDARLPRARERDDRYVGVADEPIARLLAEAVDEVDGAVWKPCLTE
jgi:hypothetical protein